VGEVGGRAPSLALIDHVATDIVPVVFGRGKPFFGTLANGHLMLEDPGWSSKATGAPFALSGASGMLDG
jgi:hypothetical protein